MGRPSPPLVRSASQAERHIRQYERELQRSVPLRERASYARAWYAGKRADGEWAFAPSKFVGFDFASVEDYLKDAGHGAQRDGRQTERLLERWFEVVPMNSRRGREMADALREFLAKFGQIPNARARINVLKDVKITSARQNAVRPEQMLDRIFSDPHICGGRPCIKGTRMRVLDIVEAIAHGATRQELLTDFDYIADEDITAALLYAAHATDHRIVRAS